MEVRSIASRVDLYSLTPVSRRAGQHVQLRLFFSPLSGSIFSLFRCFEAHPFSISNAPPSNGILNASSPDRGIELFVRSCSKGSWTGDLFETALLGKKVAQARAEEDARNGGAGKRRKMHMLALVEGPYGGLGTFTAVEQETVLLVAGGSGMSFTLGALDEILGRRVQNGQGGKIEVVWAVRDKGEVDSRSTFARGLGLTLPSSTAQIAWFEEPLRTLINSVASTPSLKVTLRIYLTCDPTLTTEPDSSSATFPPASASTPFDLLPHTQLIYARPHLATIVHDTLAAALAPCGNCYPICRCGELGGDGICANDEEECCGGSGPANGRELFEKGEADEKKGEKESFESVPKLLGGKGSCCSPAVGTESTASQGDEDEILELVASSSSATPACCSSKPRMGTEVGKAPACGGGCCASSGGGCCSGGVEGAGEPREAGPLRVRTGGMAVVVCGPGNMIVGGARGPTLELGNADMHSSISQAEMRNAVARVPIAKQARVGGIDLHSEHFSL